MNSIDLASAAAAAAAAMGVRGRRSLKKKRTRKEAPVSASSEVAHIDDLMKRDSKKHQSPATRTTAQEAEEEGGGGETKTKEKRKRVVRERLPESLIHITMVHSSSVQEISGERLAQLPEECQQDYAERKARSEKWQAEQQALIEQYLINGYAELVQEVTDDEDDGDEEDDTAKIDGSSSQ